MPGRAERALLAGARPARPARPGARSPAHRRPAAAHDGPPVFASKWHENRAAKLAADQPVPDISRGGGPGEPAARDAGRFRAGRAEGREVAACSQNRAAQSTDGRRRHLRDGAEPRRIGIAYRARTAAPGAARARYKARRRRGLPLWPSRSRRRRRRPSGRTPIPPNVAPPPNGLLVGAAAPPPNVVPPPKGDGDAPPPNGVEVTPPLRGRRRRLAKGARGGRLCAAEGAGRRGRGLTERTASCRATAERACARRRGSRAPSKRRRSVRAAGAAGCPNGDAAGAPPNGDAAARPPAPPADAAAAASRPASPAPRRPAPCCLAGSPRRAAPRRTCRRREASP